jgi:TusA-related sulfurtransferase
MSFTPETPEEVELAWQAQNPDGQIIHVETDNEGSIESIDSDPYGGDDD